MMASCHDSRSCTEHMPSVQATAAFYMTVMTLESHEHLRLSASHLPPYYDIQYCTMPGVSPPHVQALLWCRPAIVSHFSLTKTEETNVRQQWLVNFGVQLPDTIPYIVHVRFVDDCDAPTVPYPSCCVLTPGGLSHTPHQPGSHGQAMVLRKLTGAYCDAHLLPDDMKIPGSVWWYLLPALY